MPMFAQAQTIEEQKTMLKTLMGEGLAEPLGKAGTGAFALQYIVCVCTNTL